MYLIDYKKENIKGVDLGVLDYGMDRPAVTNVIMYVLTKILGSKVSVKHITKTNSGYNIPLTGKYFAANYTKLSTPYMLDGFEIVGELRLNRSESVLEGDMRRKYACTDYIYFRKEKVERASLESLFPEVIEILVPYLLVEVTMSNEDGKYAEKYSIFNFKEIK